MIAAREVLRRLRSRLHGTDAQAGVGLAELVVVMVVSSLLLVAVGTVFTSSLSAARTATVHTTGTADARLALDVMARRLRVVTRAATTDPLFVSATDRTISFYASLEDPTTTAAPAASLVQYAVDPAQRCLRETITAGSVTRSSCLAYGDEITPTFSYFRVTPLPTATTPSPSPAPTTALPLTASGLSAADAAAVGAVQIHLAWRATGAAPADRPVRLTTRVLLVNPLHEERPS